MNPQHEDSERTQEGSVFHHGTGKPPDDLGKDGDVYADHETVFDGLWLKRQDGWAFIVAPLFPEMRYTKRLSEAGTKQAGSKPARAARLLALREHNPRAPVTLNKRQRKKRRIARCWGAGRLQPSAWVRHNIYHDDYKSDLMVCSDCLREPLAGQRRSADIKKRCRCIKVKELNDGKTNTQI